MPREARPIYGDLLLRNSDDHMGIRYEVIQISHREGDREAVRYPLSAYQEDVSAFLSDERGLLGIRELPDSEAGTPRRVGRIRPHPMRPWARPPRSKALWIVPGE